MIILWFSALWIWIFVVFVTLGVMKGALIKKNIIVIIICINIHRGSRRGQKAHRKGRKERKSLLKWIKNLEDLFILFFSIQREELPFLDGNGYGRHISKYTHTGTQTQPHTHTHTHARACTHSEWCQSLSRRRVVWVTRSAAIPC